MERINAQDSISNRVVVLNRFYTIALILIAITNILLMIFFHQSYDSFVVSMDKLTSLKTIINEDIPSEVWNVVAGRITMNDCQAYDMIDTIDKLIQSCDQDVKTEVILRLLQTMRQYIAKIEDYMNQRVAIEESERLLNELRNVCELTDDVLDEYITIRIETESEHDYFVRVCFYIWCFFEIVACVFVLCASHRMNFKLELFVKNSVEKLEQFAANLAKGELNARAPADQMRELIPLTDSLNEMAEQIDKLIDQVKTEQQNLQKSELRTLQAQINPHFLYNTLDAIMWQAEAGHSEDVVQIVRALSDFFRISLSSGEEWISVAQEMKHLEGYLSIQKIRYRDILNYRIDIDPEIQNAMILKLLLQPLVENALYHGLKPKRGGGSIFVTGRQEGEELVFTVKDTGIGMSPDQVEKLMKGIHSDSEEKKENVAPESGFGLKNVDLRIRLYYNKKTDGLKIESGSTGTCVSFRLPLNRKGKENV